MRCFHVDKYVFVVKAMIVVCCMQSSLWAHAQFSMTDTAIMERPNRLPHWGYEAEFQAGRVLVLDKYQKSYMKDKAVYAASFKFTHVSLPSDNDAYAHDFHYPTFSIVGRFCKNDGATMYRSADYPHWNDKSDDYYELAPYNTHLGNSFAIYGAFSYPLYRGNRWELAVSANLGFAYSATKYDRQTSVDNDMIGAHLLFYAGGTVSATYRFAPSWGIKGAIDYWHISNGSTRQPNRSANILGPTLGVVYYPYYEQLFRQTGTFTPSAFHPYFYLNFKGGVGVQTRTEDWDRTQYKLTKDHPDFRREDFTLFSVASVQTDIMYRYARIGAFGAGVDVQYCSCYSHIWDIDKEFGIDTSHNPWAVAFDLKHTFFYGNVSLALGAGVYLFRQMGDFSRRNDPFYFNRIGVHYTIPKLHHLTAGIEVKAHLTKADFTELVISYPLRLNR